MRNPGSTRGVVRPALASLALLALALALPSTAALAAVGDVSGRLLGPAGEPLPGYSVRLVGEDGPVAESLPTDPDGRFLMSDVPAGRFEVELLDATRRPCSASIAPAVMPESGSLEVDVRLTSLPVCEAGAEPVDEPEAGTGRKPRAPGGRSKLGLGLGIAGGVALLVGLASGGSDDPPPVSPSSP